MGRLIQARRSQDIWTDEMDIYVDELEEELLIVQHADHEVIRNHPGDPQDILHVNQAMHAAATIAFYTRLRDVPFTSTLIRKSVAEVQREALCVEPDSLSSRALVFSLYIAGCEAVDGSMREMISGRISECKDYAALKTEDIRSQLSQIWDIRDRNPGFTWLQWSEQGKFRPSGG
ncbi:hypothetical protein H9Q72_007230 [Fusarium xylarioides]|uniref:Uncharacterized protein n=1 Tax=Fusarium xylarioides TaxID=221167 RepID=A0A9P7L5T6_9HYPO|nr:hypothetical protein H9Q70_009867 [Fusarium xylarioides]KAG5764678.1 hypothetical protein H9Q72_007230 [Fusarium xylarioides]KAG5769807.1 hypothetical protein H9Q73_013451 [Fusarium xylarioides]